MPYIEKTGNKAIREQLWQWEGVMHDNNIDGFNGFGCKKKVYEVLWQCQEIIKKSPVYHEEDEYLHEHKKLLISKELKRKWK